MHEIAACGFGPQGGIQVVEADPQEPGLSTAMSNLSS
jgi:hypothetical protein